MQEGEGASALAPTCLRLRAPGMARSGSGPSGLARRTCAGAAQSREERGGRLRTVRASADNNVLGALVGERFSRGNCWIAVAECTMSGPIMREES
jgi:hypothetical protein